MIIDQLVRRVHRTFIVLLMLIMCGELAFALYEEQWVTAFLVMAIIGVTLAPLYLGRQYQVHIPSEFQFLAVVFVFASLFLGEIHRYYERIWWWDMALHGSSGLLMGILGFLLVYLLNESDRIHLYMTPRFVALFAFLFAVTVGVLWEIFEFSMDRLLGTTMQKPMAGDPSGLTDTMWDLILDTLGALVVSGLGWYYMTTRRKSFIEHLIRKFIRRNPRLFRRYQRRQ